jgi:hypothetical protein
VRVVLLCTTSPFCLYTPTSWTRTYVCMHVGDSNKTAMFLPSMQKHECKMYSKSLHFDQPYFCADVTNVSYYFAVYTLHTKGQTDGRYKYLVWLGLAQNQTHLAH